MKKIIKIYLPIGIGELGELDILLGKLYPGCRFVETEDKAAIYVVEGDEQ